MPFDSSWFCALQFPREWRTVFSVTECQCVKLSARELDNYCSQNILSVCHFACIDFPHSLQSLCYRHFGPLFQVYLIKKTVNRYMKKRLVIRERMLKRYHITMHEPHLKRRRERNRYVIEKKKNQILISVRDEIMRTT